MSGSDWFAHESAVVDPGAAIGAGVSVWHFSHLRESCRVGSGTQIGQGCYVDADVVIGERCKLQNSVHVYRGVTVGDDVFIGPSVTFTNDRFPRAFSSDWEVVPTLVESGASIGAGAVIRCGVTIGAYAMVAAGAVVTRDVAAYALVAGNPAVRIGTVCRCGRRVIDGSHVADGNGTAVCSEKCQ